MSTQSDEILSVKPSQGRACRTLNVTRKIIIRDIEPIIRMSLEMTQFSIGPAVFEQIRGSPMGSPLSPALLPDSGCALGRSPVQNIQTFLASIPSICPIDSTLCRYVDNRLCLVDPTWLSEPCIANFLHHDFYSWLIILETDQEFLDFLIEFEPFALRYSPPRDFNHVMAPFPASPFLVQLRICFSSVSSCSMPNAPFRLMNTSEALLLCTVKSSCFPGPALNSAL